MIRAFAEAIGGALLILGLAVAFLLNTPPAGAAQAQHWRCGSASWYGQESGSTTATGEHFTGNDMTAAMPSRAEFGHRYRVHYGQRSVVVRVNDYGPRKDLHRIMDLSRAAAVRIGLIGRGVGTVCLERLH